MTNTQSAAADAPGADPATKVRMSEHRPLRILHLANELERCGNGIVNVMVDLAIEQRRAGHFVVVAAPAGNYLELLESHQVRHEDLPQRGPRALVLAIARLRRLIQRERIDVVHAHMVSGALAARLATVGLRSRLVTHVHNLFQRHGILMAVGHQVIAVSEAARVEMIRRGMPGHKIHTVQNGTIGSPRSEARPRSARMPLAHPAVVTVAGMYVRKGIADLVTAAHMVRERVPDAKVYLVGDGPDRPIFEDMIRSHGLATTVFLLGFRDDAEDLMSQADVFVLPSHTESSPLVIFEARAAGLPIVATAVDGIPECLDNGQAGILVPARRPEILADTIARLLTDQQMQREWRERASSNLERFRVARMAEDTLAVYRQVLGIRTV